MSQKRRIYEITVEVQGEGPDEEIPHMTINGKPVEWADYGRWGQEELVAMCRNSDRETP